MNNQCISYCTKIVLLASMFGILSACAVKNDLVGSRWVMIGQIEVPPNKAGIFFQNGKPVAAISGDQYTPWCQLVLKEKIDSFRVIKTGHYEINRVLYIDESINPTQTSFKTKMRLTSTAPVQLHEIICGNWDDNAGSYLTNKQMQQALHGVMKLEIDTH